MVHAEEYPSAVIDSVETPAFSDLARWRLKVEQGAQTWHYLQSDEELKQWPQTRWDKYFLGLPFKSQKLPRAKTPLEAARNGFDFYKELQTEDGHWAGEYGGPMFLIPGLIITHYITGVPVPEPMRLEIIRYLLNCANKDDGGWGIHTQGISTVFGTALNYVVLRILGLSADHTALIKARATLHQLGSFAFTGGAAAIPAWGKFWLSAMSVYEWDGLNPIPPELWLLPQMIPLCPGNWWVQNRMVYLPMGYIYARRLNPEPTDFILQLRDELYTEPYVEIKWDAQRNNISKADLFVHHTKVMDLINVLIYYKLKIHIGHTTGALTYYERVATKMSLLRKYSLELIIEQIRMEDENTLFLDIAPVNKVLNWLVVYYHHGKDSKEFQKHVKRNADYMWMGPNGMMMNGTNGTQLWDTTFIAQACSEARLVEHSPNQSSMLKVLRFLDDCQIKHNVPDREKCYRHVSKGAWPFSTREQGYTVSDCTAEGLKSVIALQKSRTMPKIISKERLREAVDVLLTMQNGDGGFASYERIRGPKWLEWFNPAEVFGDIMIEHSYPECTTAVLTGLCAFKVINPNYRQAEVKQVCKRALEYIKKAQRADGSWFGSWAICFTYAAMFSLTSLASMGEFYHSSDHARRGCEFLISKQKEDGGWGETYKSCETGVYAQHDKSQVVNTAYATLALLDAKYPHVEPIRRAVRLLMKRQQENGEWLQESIEGVFNKNCTISYPNYKFSFTIWALGRYAAVWGDEQICE
ncbi:hypothetical protein NQZ79_g634 [Umbelopsis isabellina]|nr:hypothetical protein NQZ79_g634 [Umbelopsis isabellina]